jgi:small subunit ribosomal protein S16
MSALRLYTDCALILLIRSNVLIIRLSRTGKTKQEYFRIVVAPHTVAVKGKYLELLGTYAPAVKDKRFEVKKDRVEYWISKGAKPSESMAKLLKKHGFANMDKFIPAQKNLQRTKKKEAKGGAPAAPAA